MTEIVYEHSLDTTASPTTVWELYRDVAGWPAWNSSVERVELDGPFAAGTTGTLTAPDVGPLPFRIVAAEEGVTYTSETDIAGTVTLRSTGRLAGLPGGGTRITQRTELVGPAAPYFAASFGPMLAAGVPRTVQALADRAVERAGMRDAVPS